VRCREAPESSRDHASVESEKRTMQETMQALVEERSLVSLERTMRRNATGRVQEGVPYLPSACAPRHTLGHAPTPHIDRVPQPRHVGDAHASLTTLQRLPLARAAPAAQSEASCACLAGAVPTRRWIEAAALHPWRPRHGDTSFESFCWDGRNFFGAGSRACKRRHFPLAAATWRSYTQETLPERSFQRCYAYYTIRCGPLGPCVS
jgi:hypothetical protein